MTEPPINDLEGLLAAFNVDSIDALAWAIEEAADIDDDRMVFIDHHADDLFLGIGVRGLEISFPTTVRAVIDMAAEVEQLNDDA